MGDNFLLVEWGTIVKCPLKKVVTEPLWSAMLCARVRLLKVPGLEMRPVSILSSRSSRKML